MRIQVLVVAAGLAGLLACGGGDVARMRALRDRMCACKDAACADQVAGDRRALARPTADPDSLAGIEAALARCERAARARSATANLPAAAPGSDGAGETTAVCDEYLKAFDRFMSCDKVPQEAKDASKLGLEQMKQAWAMLKEPSASAEAKQAAAISCKQAVDALAQSGKAMGCAM